MKATILSLLAALALAGCVGETTAVSRTTYQRELQEARYWAYVVPAFGATRTGETEAVERELRPASLTSTARAELAAEDDLCRRLDRSQKNLDVAGAVFTIAGGGVGIGSAVALDQSQAAPASTKLAFGISAASLTVVGGVLLLAGRVEARRFDLLECQVRALKGPTR